MTARDAGRGQAACSQLAANGLEAIFHPLDVTNDESVGALADTLKSRHGGVDIVISNAAPRIRRENRAWYVRGAMRLGIVTDVHLGPVEYKGGRPAKLTGYAEPLTREVVRGWRERYRPDLAINLGDVLQDESRATDLAHYRLFCSLLDRAEVPVLHVAGNHDQVHLADEDLVSLWGLGERWPGCVRHAASTAYHVDHRGFRFVVSSTRWAPPEGVFLGAGQLEFLERSLGSAPGPCVVLTHQSASEMSLSGNHWFEREPHMCLISERSELRSIIEKSGLVLAVLNGHAHWNHVDVIGNVPYVTLQSLTENVTPDGEPTPAAASALVDLKACGIELWVQGEQPLRFAHTR